MHYHFRPKYWCERYCFSKFECSKFLQCQRQNPCQNSQFKPKVLGKDTVIVDDKLMPIFLCVLFFCIMITIINYVLSYKATELRDRPQRHLKRSWALRLACREKDFAKVKYGYRMDCVMCPRKQAKEKISWAWKLACREKDFALSLAGSTSDTAWKSFSTWEASSSRDVFRPRSDIFSQVLQLFRFPCHC